MFWGFFTRFASKKTKIPTIVYLQISNFQIPFATFKQSVGWYHYKPLHQNSRKGVNYKKNSLFKL